MTATTHRRNDMLKGISGRTAVVTGAAGGIGSATVRRLHAEGANVVAVDIDEAGLEALAAELGDRVLAVRADVTSADDTEMFFQRAVDTFETVDMFHANAGIESKVIPVAAFDIADFDKVFAVNVRSAFLGSAAAVRIMMGQPDRGKIVFTASIAGLKSDAGVTVYTASKHAVVGMARGLAKETGGLGIRVNVVAPGPVDTRMMRPLEEGLGALAGLDAAGIQAALAVAIPLGRYAQADEVAATVAWLLSDEVPYMHGEVVTVRATGGMDHPAPILEAARAVASGVNAVAAIWVVPELCLTRLGSSRDGGGIGQLHADQLAGPDRCVHGVSFR